MANLVTFTVRGIDDTGPFWEEIKAEAAQAGAQAAAAYNTAFRAGAGLSGVPGGTGLTGLTGDAGGAVESDEAAIISRLRTYAHTPGGIGLLGTGTDTSLLTTLKAMILRSAENGGIGLLGTGGGVSTSDLISQVGGSGAENASTTDFIEELLRNSVTGNTTSTDYVNQVLEPATGQSAAGTSGAAEAATGGLTGSLLDDSSVDDAAEQDAQSFAQEFSSALTTQMAADMGDGGPFAALADAEPALTRIAVTAGGDFVEAFEGDVSQGLAGMDLGEAAGKIGTSLVSGIEQAASSAAGTGGGAAGGGFLGALLGNLSGGAGEVAEQEGEKLSDEVLAGMVQGAANAGGGGFISRFVGGLLGGFTSGAGAATEDFEDLGETEADAVADGFLGAPAIADIGMRLPQVIGQGIRAGSSVSDIGTPLVGLIVAATPFLAQAFSGALVGALGTGIAAMAIYGADKTGEITAMFDGLKQNAEQDLAEIGQSWVPVLNSMFENANEVMNKLTPVFAKAAQLMAGPMQQFGEALENAFGQSSVENSIYAVAEAFGDIAQAVTPVLAQAIGDVATGIENVANAIAANPQSMADFVTNMAKIAEISLDVLAALTKVANAIESWTQLWAGMGDVVKAFAAVIGPTASSAFDTVVDIVKTFADLLTGDWSGAWNALKGIFTSSMGGIEQTMGPVFDGLGKLAQDGINGLIQAFSGIDNEIDQALGSASSTISTWAEQDTQIFTNEGSQIWNGFFQNFKQGWNAVGNFIDGIPQDILNFFNSSGNWLDQAGEDIIGGFFKGIESAYDAVDQWLGGIDQDFLNWFQDAGQWLVQAGEDIINGLVKGITSAFNSIVSTVTNFINNDIIDPIEDALEIASPSKVMYRIGQMVMKGLAGGLSDGAGEVNDIMSGTASAMAGSVTGAAGMPGATAASFDQGGWLQPGYTVAHNGTGQPEPVGWGGGGGGSSPVQLEVSPGGSTAFEQFMQTAIREWVRVKGGGSVQRAFGYGTT